MYCLRWQQSAIFTEKKSPKTLAQQHSEQLVGAPADHLATKEPDISPRSQKKHTTVKKRVNIGLKFVRWLEKLLKTDHNVSFQSIKDEATARK